MAKAKAKAKADYIIFVGKRKDSKGIWLLLSYKVYKNGKYQPANSSN